MTDISTRIFLSWTKERRRLDETVSWEILRDEIMVFLNIYMAFGNEMKDVPMKVIWHM